MGEQFMKSGWKKAITIAAIFAGTIVAILLNKDNDSFESWIGTASDEDLADGYEQRRQQWLKDDCGGNGEKTYEMKKINNEMDRRSAEKWENDPRRNRDPNFRWTDANRWDKD